MKLKKIDTSTSNNVELALLLMETKFIYVDESMGVELPYTLVECDLKPALVVTSVDGKVLIDDLLAFLLDLQKRELLEGKK